MAGFTHTLKRAFGFAYDAAEPSNRRRAITVDTRPEESILDPKKRSKVISGSRDLRRNFAVAAWALRTHCSHVAQHTFQCRSGVPEVDDQVESLMTRFGNADRCDAAGRHPLYRLIYLLEMGRLQDGDILLTLLEDGRTQTIESDRIATPRADEFKKHTELMGLKPAEFVQGVQIDSAGRAIAYAVNSRSDKGKLSFQKLVPAESAVLHGYFDRTDQVRGVSPLTAALNSFLDLAEATEYALAKAKIAQYLGVKITRAAADALDAGQPSEGTQGPINFGKGPVIFDMNPGDDVQFMHTDTPGTSFQEFMKLTVMAALKAIDLDYSFFDASHTNYSGSRQALLLYQRSAHIRQREVRDVLDRLTRWNLARWISTGELRLPNGLSIDTLRWEWIPAGLGWIDPLKEIKAHAAAVDAGLDSRQRIARERGEDWFEIADQLAEEQAYARTKGIALTTDAAAGLIDAPEPQTQETSA